MTSEDQAALAAAKVGDYFYVAYRDQVSRIAVVKVCKRWIELANGVKISVKTGRETAQSWLSMSYYPATPENVARYEPQLQAQRLRERTRRALRTATEALHAEALSDEQCAKLARAIEDVLG